jgi:hypothetical protein
MHIIETTLGRDPEECDMREGFYIGLYLVYYIFVSSLSGELSKREPKP